MTAAASITVALVVGLVVGIVAAAVLLQLTALAGARRALAEKSMALDELSERERQAQGQAADARSAQARAEAEAANARSEWGAAGERERLVRGERDRADEVAEARARTFQQRIADLGAAHAKVLADLETARAERESAERRTKTLECDLAALREGRRARERELEADLENLRTQARLAEITSALNARLDELCTALTDLHTAREEDNQELANRLGSLREKANELLRRSR